MLSFTRGRARPLAMVASLGLAMTLSVVLAGATQADLSSAPSVGVGDGGSLGPILTDPTGATLYMFVRDSSGMSTCNGQCATVWPPVVTDTDPVAPADLAGTFDATTRDDGARQITYNGMPLYRYIGDAQPGDTNGQGLNSFGGLWFVVNPAG